MRTTLLTNSEVYNPSTVNQRHVLYYRYLELILSIVTVIDSSPFPHLPASGNHYFVLTSMIKGVLWSSFIKPHLIHRNSILLATWAQPLESSVTPPFISPQRSLVLSKDIQNYRVTILPNRLLHLGQATTVSCQITETPNWSLHFCLQSHKSVLNTTAKMILLQSKLDQVKTLCSEPCTMASCFTEEQSNFLQIVLGGPEWSAIPLPTFLTSFPATLLFYHSLATLTS